MSYQPQDEDVVTMAPESSGIIKAQTFRIAEFLSAFKLSAKQGFGLAEAWLQDGVKCRFLKANGGGWQEGKIRLRLEFIPDEPESQSSLDVIRSQMNQLNQ